MAKLGLLESLLGPWQGWGPPMATVCPCQVCSAREAGDAAAGMELPCRARGEGLCFGDVAQLDGGDIQHPLLQPPPTPEGPQGTLHPPRQGQAARGRGEKRKLLLLLQPSFIKSQKTAAIKRKVQHARLSPH